MKRSCTRTAKIALITGSGLDRFGNSSGQDMERGGRPGGVALEVEMDGVITRSDQPGRDMSVIVWMLHPNAHVEHRAASEIQ
jgi:hypothetical protein